MSQSFASKSRNKILIPLYVIATAALTFGFADMLSRFIEYIAVSANISISMVAGQLKFFIYH